MKNRAQTGLLDGIKPIYRLGIVLLGLFFVGLGVLHVLSGRTNFFNPWGQLVFAPSAILVGLSIIAANIFAWVRNK